MDNHTANVHSLADPGKERVSSLRAGPFPCSYNKAPRATDVSGLLNTDSESD